MFRWSLSIIVAAALFFGGYHVGRTTVRFVETEEPPLATTQPLGGPFRPRPKPPVPPDPEPPQPAPQSDDERKLFGRLEAWMDARAKRIEDRANARAEQRVNEAFDEIAANLDAAARGTDPELLQGAFGGAFVAKLATFVKNAIVFVVKAVIVGVLGGLIVQYWFIVGPVALFLFIALPAWSARTFAKKTS
jgi:hypothetical protein